MDNRLLSSEGLAGGLSAEVKKEFLAKLDLKPREEKQGFIRDDFKKEEATKKYLKRRYRPVHSSVPMR